MANPSGFLFLDQAAVLAADVLDMPRAIDVVADALRLFETGQCVQPYKVVLRDSEDARSEEAGRFNGLCASIKGARPAIGFKWIGSYPSNRARGLPRASAVIILNSPVTGLPVAIMEGALVSAMRTGAITALGVRHLAPRGSLKVAVIGGGVQARTQVLALHTAIPGLREIAVWCRRPGPAESLRQECSERFGAPMTVSATVRAAVSDADVVVTVTTSHEPLIRAADLKPGALTIQMSGHECEFDVVRGCRKIVTDNWDAMKHRNIITPALMHAQGLLADADIYGTLGELILGLKPGREEPGERIHFAHMGMGVEDVALAAAVYETARSRGLGRPLRLWEAPFWA